MLNASGGWAAIVVATSIAIAVPAAEAGKTVELEQRFVVEITDVRPRTPRTWRREIDLECRRDASGPRCDLQYLDVDLCGRAVDSRPKQRIEYRSGYANVQWAGKTIVLVLGRAEFNHRVELVLDASSRVVSVRGGGYDLREELVTKWTLVPPGQKRPANCTDPMSPDSRPRQTP